MQAASNNALLSYLLYKSILVEEGSARQILVSDIFLFDTTEIQVVLLHVRFFMPLAIPLYLKALYFSSLLIKFASNVSSSNNVMRYLPVRLLSYPISLLL